MLPNGQVLITGGYYDGINLTANAELYDPASGTFTATGSMAVARYAHTATLLGNGDVLVVGGYDGTTSLSSAELYDPGSGTFTATDSMSAARSGHTATVFMSAELYDPEAGTFTATGSMIVELGTSAILLADGKVLITGGYDGTNFVRAAEVYDPVAGAHSQPPTACPRREIGIPRRCCRTETCSSQADSMAPALSRAQIYTSS